jgi:hypothetical protein
VQIEVTDHGPGIPAEEQASIFDRFVRGFAGRQRPEGTGLGLHIVQTLVALHGGTVGVKSVLGQGATFWVRLPLLAVGDGVLCGAPPGPEVRPLAGPPGGDERARSTPRERRWRLVRREAAGAAAIA